MSTQFILKQIPNCAKAATLTMTTGSMTLDTTIETTYGISVTQTSSSDYKTVYVSVAIETDDLTLAD